MGRAEMPFHFCLEHGCSNLVERGRCAIHQQAYQQAHGRIAGRKLQRIRADVFRDTPLCVRCQKLGLVTVATQVDHVLPLSQGGQDVPSNRQALCWECHAQKTREER